MYDDDVDELGTTQKVHAVLRAALADKFIFLKASDKWEAGDRYGVGFCYFVGGDQTGAKVGQTVGELNMCYLPRRPKA